jgi:hypothetical protein
MLLNFLPLNSILKNGKRSHTVLNLVERDSVNESNFVSQIFLHDIKQYFKEVSFVLPAGFANILDNKLVMKFIFWLDGRYEHFILKQSSQLSNRNIKR